MARLAQKATREDVAPEKRHLFDEIVARRGELSGPTTFFMNSPEMAVIYSQLADYVRMNGLLNPGQVRLAGMMVGREFSCQYIWAVNQPHTVRTGPSAAMVNAIANRLDISGMPKEELTLARFVGELLKDHKVSDASFNATRELLGSDQAVLELTGVVSLYTMIANMVNAFELDPPPNTPRLPMP